MIKARIVRLAALAGCLVLSTGCALTGASCLKAPAEADVQNHAPLRIPVGLDPVDTTEALKVPPLDNPAPPPAFSRCLEDPPMIQPLPDPKITEKEQKKALRKARREERAAKKQAKKEEKEPK